MSLLFDHNLSPVLVRRLADLHPGSVHVWPLGPDRDRDGLLWQHAKDHGFTLVSKDSDFEGIGNVRGVPPKWIWVRLGNSSTREGEFAFRSQAAAVAAFLAHPTEAIYELH